MIITPFGPEKNCTLHHIRALRNELNTSLGIKSTPGGKGHELDFDATVKRQVEWAIKHGIEGPFLIKLSIDSANMTAGKIFEFVLN